MNENELNERLLELMKWRIENFKLLFLQRLTPLFRKELQDAIAVHDAAVEDITARGDHHSLKDLDAVQAQIHEHWTKVYGDFVSHARLMQNIGQFQTYLTAKLLEDYVGQHYTSSDFELEQTYLVEQHDTVKNTSDDRNSKSHSKLGGGGGGGDRVDSNKEVLLEAYQINFIDPLEEMTLDKNGVEHRLRMVIAGRQHARGVVQRLIDNCDWSNLAVILVNDRVLALALAEQVTIKPGLFENDTKVAVLRGIDKIQTKYFERLSSASTYTISRLATERSVKEVSDSTGERQTAAPETADPSEGTYWKIRAKSLYNTFTSGLRGGRPISSLKAVAHLPSHKDNLDEKDPLIESKKSR